MARYILIDTEKIDLEKIGVDPFYSYDVLRSAMLSPEETEAKWKEVFEAGAADWRGFNHSTEWGFDYNEETSFDNFKQSL